MNIKLFPTLKKYKKTFLARDIFSGIIIAAVSIPISMGYAQIAGLPAVYGLYGSVFPILFFALFPRQSNSFSAWMQPLPPLWARLFPPWASLAEAAPPCSMFR